MHASVHLCRIVGTYACTYLKIYIKPFIKFLKLLKPYLQVEKALCLTNNKQWVKQIYKTAVKT